MSNEDNRKEPELISTKSISNSSVEENNQNNESKMKDSDSETKQKSSIVKAKTAPMWILIAAIILVAVIWVVGTTNSDSEKDATIPLITSNKAPIKVKPENPGGKHIENRDKYVYKSLTDSDASSSVEQLLPPAEEPLVVDNSLLEVPNSNELASELNSDQDDSPILNQHKSTDSDKEIIKNDVSNIEEESNVTNHTSTINSHEVSISETENEEVFETEGELSKVETKQNLNEKYYQVQIAASKNKNALINEWTKLKEKNPDILSSLSYDLVPVNPDKNTSILRLRVGKFNNKNDASALCKTLKQRGTDCYTTLK